LPPGTRHRGPGQGAELPAPARQRAPSPNRKTTPAHAPAGTAAQRSVRSTMPAHAARTAGTDSDPG